ncbi:hypothetical protein CI610_03675 [invertebrate metagenome]|uniref:Uncharacterized protein n=1 Tax=invertebrate metagenome TaxID=1711999 RepID=A0A2H9T2G4_9ZZZZ
MYTVLISCIDLLKKPLYKAIYLLLYLTDKFSSSVKI